MEEVSAILPPWGLASHEFQISLMDKSGCLQGLSGRFQGHLSRRLAAQFVVNHREQLCSGGGIAALNRIRRPPNPACR